RPLVARVADEVEEEDEDVRDVENDADGDRYRLPFSRLAEAIEGPHRVAAEDGEDGDRVDDVAGPGRDECRDEAECEQLQQCPEGDPMVRRESPASPVPGRTKHWPARGPECWQRYAGRARVPCRREGEAFPRQRRLSAWRGVAVERPRPPAARV